MDEDKRNRRRALEAGREMLEAYKNRRSNVKQNNSLEQANDESQFITENEQDDQSIHIRSENHSMDQITMSNNESGMSSALCSVSMSEGEGDGELEGLAGRVTELRELLQGKEAVVEALHAEIDDLRIDVSSPTSSHSQNSNKDSIPMYLAKLHEFERAVNQRDNLIEDLTTSLQQALTSRDAALAKIKVLSSSLENSVEKNEIDFQEHKFVGKLEGEKEIQNTELGEYKNQVENLNKKIRADSVELDVNPSEISQLHAIYQDQIEKIKKDMKLVCDKFAAEIITNNEKHENEKKELITKYESELIQFREENKNLEIRHTKEMSVFQSQLSNYKRIVESLKLDLVTRNESHTREKELLSEQIKLHKLQLDEMATKFVTAASVFDSKESIERSLEQALVNIASLRTENESLKFKLDDLSSRYSEAQSLIESNQMHERTLNEHIFSLTKSISRLSGAEFSSSEPLDATTYQHLNDQLQGLIVQVDEKSELETKLNQRIEDLEQLVSKTKSELDATNLIKDSYEKQIKDMKNTCDRLRAEINSNYIPDESLDRMPSVEFEKEVLELKKAVEKREKETAEYLKRLKELEQDNHRLVDESEKLKHGLVVAYAQCAAFEEKLDQTLGFGDSKLEDSAALLNITVDSNASSWDLEEVLQRQKSYNIVLKKLDACHEQIKEYEELAREKGELLEKAQKKENQLLAEIEALKIENSAEIQRFKQVLSSLEAGSEGLENLRIELEARHAKEMEELRTYFEQKCLQMEKQYSEEIFSQQSRKMSDNDSEIEELTDDLYIGGGGDVQDNLIKESKKDTLGSCNDSQKITYDDKIIKITAEYEEKLENLRRQLKEIKEKTGRTVLLKAVNQCCQTEQSSPGSVQENCNELNELRADYNRQLEEQVGLARIDIINALQQQIEALLKADSESDENWPSELLELRNKFTNNAKKEIQSLKERHNLEIKCLKEEHNQIIYNLQEEIKQVKSETHESLQNNLLKERDTLHKTCTTLKSLVIQLIDYFADCEEELNNTLINEVLRKQYSPRSDIFDSEQMVKNKRVRFAPQSTEIAQLIGSDNDLQDLINSEKDIMKILKKDLDVCLARLKNDSAKILNVSISDSESWSTGIGDSPGEKLMEAEKLLAEAQEENEHLKVKIIDLQQRLIIAENKKEIVTEGYGQQDETIMQEEAEEDFSQLLDRAKFVVVNGSNDTVYLIHLIEKLCRFNEKAISEIQKEKEDLQNQVPLVPTPTPNNQIEVVNTKIGVADKKIRSMCKFQDEQALEREAERDEAFKQIKMLKEQLRERERENRDFRVKSTEPELSSASSSTGSSTLRQSDESEIDASIEVLSTQVREFESRAIDAEKDLEQAISKIRELKQIIHELKVQVQTRTEKEEILSRQIEQYEEVIVAQTKNQQELAQELENLKLGSDSNHLSDHIGHLQEELRKHQLSSEQLTANSSALKQIRLELRELQNQLNKKTRELESIHICGSSLSLSQPSEDISIRDQLDATRCPTPDEPNSPPVLPLDHVLKLKDNLMKHFRAEDAALKRLKDIEIQLGGLQRQNEDLLTEQEMLQQTTSEQLFQIETLRARLEQQKQNAPFAQRQATSRLESQLFEVNDKLEIAERALIDKDIELAEVKGQLERMSRILAEKEIEILNVVKSENDVMLKLRHKLEELEEENKLLQAKLSVQEKGQNLPQVIDTLLAEKNLEIDHLRKQLSHYTKQLEAFESLNNCQEFLHQNETQAPKVSARTLSDILSIHSEEDLCEAIREAPHFMKSQNVSNLKMPNSIIQSTMLQSKKDSVDFSQPITETPKVPILDLGSSRSSSGTRDDAFEASKELESLKMHLDKIPLASLTSHTDADETQEDSESNATDHENFVCPRHGHLNTSQNACRNISTDQRIQELETHLGEIKDQLNAKCAALDQRNAELLDIQKHLDQLQENIVSLNNDRLYYKVEYEKSKENESKIQKDLEEVENELKIKNEELEQYKEKSLLSHRDSKRQKRNEIALHDKIKEVNNLKQIISEKDITIETLQSRNTEIERDLKDLDEYRRKFEAYQQEISNCHGEIQRLSDSLNSRDQMIKSLEELARRNNQSRGSSPSAKDQEIYHLQEYLKEKDNIIRQMSDDSKSLQRALEAIQNKMKESGNVVELRKKLKEERKINVELSEQIAKLRTEVELLSVNRRVEEENDITEKVQRELNLSAKLDQQLLNVIDSEPEEVLKNCQNLKKANKEIDEFSRLNDDLEIEREMLKSQLSEYENRIMQLKSDLETETKRIAKIEEALSKEKHLTRSLQLQLEREKLSAEECKMQDTDLITMLRIKLSEALEARDTLSMEKKNIEIMNSLQSQNKSESDLQTEMKKEQLALIEKLEAEQHKNVESKEIIKKLEADKERLKKQFETASLEIDNLKAKLSNSELKKDQLTADLQMSKEELKSKIKENECQKTILKTMKDAEEKRNHLKSIEHSELKNLKRQLKNTHDVLIDFEADMKSLKEQLTEAAERETQLTRCIESLTDKETELTEQLSAAKGEDNKLREIIREQQNELKIYLKRESELAELLRRDSWAFDKNSSPTKILSRLKGLNTTIERLTQDKVHLYEKVAQLREENERYLDQIRFLETQLSQKNRSSNSVARHNAETDERLQHFYGKYLRSDSRRKALIFQKNYLLCIIAGYQHAEENTLAFLSHLTMSQRNFARGKKHQRNPRVRFRSIVLAIISTQRMKWLILRWRTGKRVGANVVLGVESERNVSRQRSIPNGGHSPPVKERTTNGPASSFSHQPYFQRFTSIQHNLHLRVPESISDNYNMD